MHEEEFLKQAAMNKSGSVGAAFDPSHVKGCCDVGARPGLRDRVEKQMHHASDEADRYYRLSELATLLAQNPEVARILDLVEMVRG